MTKEEAIFCEKSYIGETNCTDCKYYGTETCKSRESHKMAIKALEQESVLEKIRSEIERIAKDYDKFADYRRIQGLWIALDIIDKYKTKSEE